MAIQPAGAANGSHASLGPFPVSHGGTLMVFTEANSNLNRVIGQSVQHERMSVLRRRVCGQSLPQHTENRM